MVVPENKGNEAMAYLTHIIENYDHLPSILLFLHAHRNGFKEAWHTDAPLHDQVIAVRSLQLPYILKHGYVNLRCNPDPGCLNNGGKTGASLSVTPGIWNDMFTNTSTTPRKLAARVDHDEQSALARSSSASGLVSVVPEIRVACCAQFGLSKQAILGRPRDDYIRFRNWLLDTKLPNSDSGCVFEYLWHIIFGQKAVQ